MSKSVAKVVLELGTLIKSFSKIRLVFKVTIT